MEDPGNVQNVQDEKLKIVHNEQPNTQGTKRKRTRKPQGEDTRTYAERQKQRLIEHGRRRLQRRKEERRANRPPIVAEKIEAKEEIPEIISPPSGSMDQVRTAQQQAPSSSGTR